MSRRCENLPRKLSALFKEDFAYPTIKDRLPVILTKVVDTLARSRNDIRLRFGEEINEELKDLIGQYSKLKNEIQTNKPFRPLDDAFEDCDIWRRRLDIPAYEENSTSDMDVMCDAELSVMLPGCDANSALLSWFNSSWLLAECYFYRRISSAVFNSKRLSVLDPFEFQKRSSLEGSKSAVASLGQYVLRSVHTHAGAKECGELKSIFKSLLYSSLWGNKCDLSISGAEDNNQTTNILDQLTSLCPDILQDDSDQLWQLLSTPTCLSNTGNEYCCQRVDIILDNAGFELFADMCLGDFLVSSLNVKEVCFHCKSMPWFVSDVTEGDWCWTLDWLSECDALEVVELTRKWMNLVESGRWKLKKHFFWTLPDSFHHMESSAPDLFRDLAKSDLVIFKGDLNYRKLTGDRKWPFSAASFSEAVAGFDLPRPLCVLRTLKSDTVIGLAEEVVQRASSEKNDWLISGSYAVIQVLKNPPLTD